MRKIALLLLVLLTSTISAQKPELEFVMELRVTCDKAYSAGTNQHGERIVIPITGGTFEGPKIKGTVLPGGADYQLYDKGLKRTELEAIYCIRTDDGTNIHVRNCGILTTGNVETYFRTAPRFEAPIGSSYEWLNNAIYVCVPEGAPDYVILRVWMVK